jgi:hypothetical protein
MSVVSGKSGLNSSYHGDVQEGPVPDLFGRCRSTLTVEAIQWSGICPVDLLPFLLPACKTYPAVEQVAITDMSTVGVSTAHPFFGLFVTRRTSGHHDFFAVTIKEDWQVLVRPEKRLRYAAGEETAFFADVDAALFAGAADKLAYSTNRSFSLRDRIIGVAHPVGSAAVTSPVHVGWV